MHVFFVCKIGRFQFDSAIAARIRGGPCRNHQGHDPSLGYWSRFRFFFSPKSLDDQNLILNPAAGRLLFLRFKTGLGV